VSLSKGQKPVALLHLMRHISKLLLLLGLVALLAACTPATPPAPAPSTIPAPDLPLTEADVPRVSASDAKAAFDSGEAVIVDVRDAASYELEHVAGAPSIPLADIEGDPTAFPLDKARWIITYCT